METVSGIPLKIILAIVIALLIGYFIGKQNKSEIKTPTLEPVKSAVQPESKPVYTTEKVPAATKKNEVKPEI